MNDYTGAAFLLAIAAPIITSIVNLLAQEIKQHRDFHLTHQTEVIEDYVKYTGSYLRFQKDGTENYGAAYGNVLLCIPSEIAQKVIELNLLITPYLESENQEKAMILFNDICLLLSGKTKYRKNKRKSK